MKALNAQRRADRPRGAEARRRKSGWIPASFLSILVALAGGLGSPRAATAADGTWTNTATGGLWSDWLNWLDSFVAGDAGFTADFNTLDLAEDVTVHLDAPVTIGSLTLGDTDTNTAAGWILDNNGDATNILTLAGASNANTITVNALGAGKTATISAEITGTANPGLIKKGAGILVLSATNTYTGATRISNGVVRADYGVGVPTAGNLNLAGGVLEIAQDLTAAYGTAAGQVQWTASGAGFSAFGSATVTVDCGSTPRSYPQQTGELVLNGARANQDLIFRTPLTYTARGYVRVASPSNGATMTGKWKIQGSSVHSGKFGAGTLTLQGGWDVDGAGGTDPNVYEGRLTMDNCNIQWTGANISDFNLSRPMPAPYAAAKEKAVLELRGSATLYGKYAAGGGGISMGSTNASDVELNGGTAIVSRIYRTGSQRTSTAYHRQTTGPEILGDFAGRRLDFFVTGWGTGGTLTGAGEMIRLARPEVQVIATEPAGASLLAGAEFKPHKIQGWTPDFVPKVLNRSVPHRIVPVTDEESIAASRSLARNEGIFCGISSGGTFAAALKVAETAPEGAVLLAILPDTAERYMSTPLFEGIAEGSDPEP